MVRLYSRGVSPLHQLRDEMDRWLEGIPHETPRFTFGGSPSVFPAINVWEDDTSLLLEAELPGMKVDDLNITVVGDQLTLQGERKFDDTDDVTVHQSERTNGSFTRTLTLPAEVDVDQVEATLTDGVLQLRLPKAAATLPHKIDVKTG
jgi:HSP20 family protein